VTGESINIFSILRFSEKKKKPGTGVRAHIVEGIFMGYNICKIISEDICAGN
jgi:hypothetical protein